MTAFEHLISFFRKIPSRQDSYHNEKKTSGRKLKKTDQRSVNLSAYVDHFFERPNIQERFPVKPSVLCSNDVKFVTDDHKQKVCLGSGQMGIVYLGRLKKGSQKVAVKVGVDPRCNLHFVIHEAALMIYLNDTGATPYCYGLLPLESNSGIEEVPMAALVMDIAGGRDLNSPHMDLRSFVGRHKGKLGVDAWKSLFVQLCEQIHKIHERGIIMNDIKEENTIITRREGLMEDFTVQIIDFGSSKYGNYSFPIDPKLSKAEFREEYSHVAPEIYHEAKVNEMTDVFSLASIFCDAGNFLNISDLVSIGIKCGNPDPSLRPNVRTVISMLSAIRA